MEIIFGTGFLILFPSVFVWLYLCSKLFKKLEQSHPEVYQSIESPSLFGNNNPRNNYLFLKFLLSKKWQKIEDSDLRSLCNAMVYLFIAMLVIFSAMIISFTLSLPALQ